MIRILTGWSNPGGSTTALINLTNLLNENGYESIMYGPHDWASDKCAFKSLPELTRIESDDKVIAHFIQLQNRPQCKKVLLACHEKNLFEVADVNQYWDEVIFLNERHREYHSEYKGKYRIIPNVKEPLIYTDKPLLNKVAGIIGSFDENKQTHVSIQRALADGCEKIYLFGNPNTDYFNMIIKPMINDKIELIGFMEEKQKMYDMIGRVYLSSVSEVAPLVRTECEQTGTVFYGNDATSAHVIDINNSEILSRWIKALKP